MKFMCGNVGIVTLLDSEANKELYKGECQVEIDGANINISIDDTFDCYDCDMYYLNNDTGSDCQGSDKICHEFRFKR